MYLKRRILNFSMIIGLFLGICVLLSRIPVFTYTSLLCLMVYCFYVFRNNAEFFIKYMMFFYSMTASIIGCVICEFSDLYLNEIDSYGHFVGSLPLLIFTYWLIMSIIVLIDNNISKKSTIGLEKNENKSFSYLKIMTIAYFLISVILFLKVAQHPSFVLGIDRVAYAATGYVSGIWSGIANFMQYLVVIPIMSFFYVNKKIGAICITPYILFLFWTGNKFGTFFNIFYIFLFVLYGKLRFADSNKIRKVLTVVFVASGVLILISLFAISFSGTYVLSDYFFNRVAQQGQLWWKTYDLYAGTTNPSMFINEIYGLFSGKEVIAENVGSNFGIYNIMYLTAPTTKVDYKIMAGSRYTEAGLAAILYYFGIPGLVIFSVGLAVLLIKITNSTLKSIESESIFKAMILLRLYMAVRVATSMFLFFDFIDVISIASYCYLLTLGTRKLKLKI